MRPALSEGAHSVSRIGADRLRRFAADFLAGSPATLVIPLLAAAFFILYPQISGGNRYWINEFAQIAVLALVVSGVNLSFGYAGEVQFGQVFMFALGAYGAAIFAGRVGVEIIPLILVAVLAAAAAGAIVAIPALRMGGWSLAMVSFYLVITIPDLITLFQKYTGGLPGLADIPIPKLFGHELGLTGLYEVTIATLIIWLACYRNLVTSRYGVIFRTLRESPVLTSSLGFSPRRLKFTAYVLGAAPAGAAGCLFGFLGQFLTPDSFGLTLAIAVVAASVLGGVESVYGAVIGAAILQLGPQRSLSFQQYAPVVYGAFLIIAAVAFRRGLGGLGKAAALKASHMLVGGAEGAHVIAPGSLSGGLHDDAVDEARAAEADAIRDHASLLRPRAAHELVVHDVSKAFGGVNALSEVSLSARPGEVTGLIGSNGSGKTTLLNVICGFTRPDAGYVELGGQRLTGRAPQAIARLNVTRTFQTPSIPRGVSVLDVVASGRFVANRCGLTTSILRLPRYWRERRADRSEALIPLELVELAHLADSEATQLPLGTRRLVEIARALCADAQVLLLDEPASGLSEEEVETLGRVIRTAAAAGSTVVLIEHNFKFVSNISNVIHVLHTGERIATGSPAEVEADPSVIASYLGALDSQELDPSGVPHAIAGPFDVPES